MPGTIVVKLHMYIYVKDYIHEQKKHEHTLKEKKTHTQKRRIERGIGERQVRGRLF